MKNVSYLEIQSWDNLTPQWTDEKTNGSGQHFSVIYLSIKALKDPGETQPKIFFFALR